MNTSMNSNDECAICYQKMVLPLTLTCNHSYCFLCIKGVHETMTPPLCPMCREDISPALFKKPNQVGKIDMKDPEDSPRRQSAGPSTVKQEPGRHVQITRDSQGNIVAQTSATPIVKPDPDQKTSYWLYQSGANSWWRFDPRCEKDLTAKMEAGEKQFDMMIVGHAYRMDLESMMQERLDRMGGDATGGRARELLRVESVEELKALHVKGIAGVTLSAN